MKSNKFCVIMCGGVGSRFRPFSRDNMPKQFLDFFGTGRSLLQMAVDRVRPVVPCRKHNPCYECEICVGDTWTASGDSGGEHSFRACAPQHGPVHMLGRQPHIREMQRRSYSHSPFRPSCRSKKRRSCVRLNRVSISWHREEGCSPSESSRRRPTQATDTYSSEDPWMESTTR